MADPEDRAGPQRRMRKTRDRSLILMLLGLVLLMPPIAGIFEIEARVAGVPVVLVYLFVVWAVLIIGAAAIAPGLRADHDDTGDAAIPGRDGGSNR